MTCARLGEEQRPACVHAESAIPLLRRQLEERRRRERSGGADEDVEPAVAVDDLRDERFRVLDLGEIRRVRRRSRPEPRDRRVEVAVRQVDARDARPGRDERLGAREADPALRARDERDLPVEPPRSGRTHASAMTASTSTGMSNGRCGTPTDVRAARRSGP